MSLERQRSRRWSKSFQAIPSSRLQGVFPGRALAAVGQAARDEKPFGASALREITVAHAELLGELLSELDSPEGQTAAAQYAEVN